MLKAMGGGGNGGGGDPPPTVLPDVAYDLVPLPVPAASGNLWIRGMNEQLQIVGHTSDNDTSVDTAYLYDHSDLTAYSLEDLISNVDYQDLISQGWVQSTFRGINDWGIVVGVLENSDDTVQRGFTLDLRTIPATLDVDGVPNFGATIVRLLGINNHADIVGWYFDSNGDRHTFVYNPGLAENGYNVPDPIAARDLGFYGQRNTNLLSNSRLTIVRGPVGNEFWYLYDIENDSGPTLISDPNASGSHYAMDSIARSCGRINAPIKGNKMAGFPVVWDNDGSILWQGSEPAIAGQLNDPSTADLANGVTLGDVLLRVGLFDIDYWLYSPSWGELALVDLIDPTDPNLAEWLVNGLGDPSYVFMTEKRLNTNFGAIAGSHIGNIGSGGWLLIPRPLGPNPGITISPTSGLVTTEAGGTDSFDVELDTQPTHDVVVGISSSNTAEGDVDKASLTFTPENWDTAQTVTVIGVDDLIEDDDQGYAIETATATSTDPDYNGLDANDVSVTNEDDDGPASGSETYSSDVNNSNLAIPDNDSGGVASYILVGSHAISNLTVNVDITHQRPSDLEVYLIDPDGGPPVQLFNFTGDNAVAGFNGTNSAGIWKLEVYDTKKKRIGTLNSWSITVDY